MADDKNSTQPTKSNRTVAGLVSGNAPIPIISPLFKGASSVSSANTAASLKKNTNAGKTGLRELKKSARVTASESIKKLALEKEALSRLFRKKDGEVRAIKAALVKKQGSLEKKIVALRKEYAGEKARLLREFKRGKSGAAAETLEAQEIWAKREREIKHMQDKALKELKAAEEKLLAERERTWLGKLKSKEDEAGILKVELALQESKIRALAEKKEAELAGIREQSEKLVEERTRKVSGEKERLLGMISLKENEAEEMRKDFKEKEQEYLKAIEAQELEKRLASARAEQELKERERTVWSERESWLSAVKAQFDKKEKDFNAFLAREKESAAKAEAEHKARMAGLMKELEKKDTEIERLRTELETLIKKKEDQVLTLTAAFRTEIKSLGDRLSRQETEKTAALKEGALKEERLRREIEASEKSVAELKARFSGQESVWKEKLELKSSEALGAKSEVLQKARELEEVRANLTSEKNRLLDNLNRRETEITRELGTKNGEITTLQIKLDGIDREWRTKLEAERQDLFGRLTAAEFALKREEGRAAAAVSRHEQAVERLAIAEAEVKTAREAAGKFEAELRSIKTEKRIIEDEYSARLSEREDRLKKLVRESASSELELVSLRAEVRKLELDRDLKLSHSNERVLALEAELKKRSPLPAERDEQLRAARELSDERQKKLIAFYDNVGRLEQEKFRSELETKKVKEELERAGRDLAASKAEALVSSAGKKQSEDELRSALRQKDSTELQLKQYSAEYGRLERDLSSAAIKKEAAEARLAELTERHNTLERARKEAEEARLVSEEQYAELYAEYERLSGESESPSARELEELREGISGYEAEKTALKKDLARSASERARLAAAAEQAEHDAETAKAALRTAERGFEDKLYAETLRLREKERLLTDLNALVLKKESEMNGLRAEFDTRVKQLKEEYERREKEYLLLAGNVESRLSGLKASASTEPGAAGSEAEKLRFEAGRQLYRVEQLTSELLFLRNEIKGKDEQLIVVNKEKAEAIKDLSAKLEASDSQARDFAERILTEQKKLVDVLGLNEQLKAELASGFGFPAQSKLKEAELETLKQEYKFKLEEAAARSAEALKTREEALSRVAEAERSSKEKDLELLGVKTKLSTQIKELSGHIEIKEKELQGIRSMLSEMEQKARADFEFKEEELKLAINRLQLQLKNVTGKTEAELNEKEQKMKSMQTEYALREVQWQQQKDSSEKDRARIALFEAEIARLREESSNSVKELQAVIEHQNRRLAETENYLHIREEESRTAKVKLQEEVAAREELQAAHLGELSAKEGMFAAKEWGLNAKIGELAKERNDLEAEKVAIANRIDETEIALATLRRRFKLLLWFWYPNEPRN